MKTLPKAHREPGSTVRARRSFLKAVGACATALPFYKLIENSFAASVGGPLPLKFVGMKGYHGTAEKLWARQAGEPLDAELSFNQYSLRYSNSPFSPFDDPAKFGSSFKDKVNIFEGFDYGVGWNKVPNDSGKYECASGISSHGASAIFLTGSGVTDGNFAPMNHALYNASLDQYLAALYGGQTRFRSVELATHSLAYQQSGTAIAVGPGGALLRTMTSPATIWDKFFSSYMGPTDPGAIAAAAKKRAVGKSILDYSIAGTQRLQSRLAGPEKQKLDQHLTVLRDLERRIQPTTAPMSTACAVPPRRAPNNSTIPYHAGAPYDDEVPYYDALVNLQVELLAEILICDLSRFATLVMPGRSGASVGPLIPRPGDGAMVPSAVGTDIDVPIPANFHDDIAHTYGFDGPTPEHQTAAAAVTRYYHGKVARLMKRLNEAGVLDSTVILVGNEGGVGGHYITNIPLVMAGGANGLIKMGRRITAPGRSARTGAKPVPTANPSARVNLITGVPPTSHVPILVAVANAFHKSAGVPEIDSYGTCAAYPDMIKGVQGLI